MSEVRALYRPPIRVKARAKVAQLVELTTENRAVGSSSLPLGTNNMFLRQSVEPIELFP
jgi:hypothetical protein